MKILMFNYEYPPLGGGGGVFHHQIAEELARRHEVVVVTSGSRGLPAIEVVGGVSVHRVPVLGRNSRPTASLLSMLTYVPASIVAGEKLLRSFRPDVMNTHFAVPSGPGPTLLAGRHALPHVVSILGGDIYDPSKRLSPHRMRMLRAAVRWVLRRADRVIAGSCNTAENARKYYGFGGEIGIIPLGLKKPDLPLYARPELGLGADQVVLVTVGRLVPRKANDQLVELVARLRDPRVRLVLLGEGPEQGSLQALARTRGVEGQVLMPGYVDDTRKFQYLQAADAFVSTSGHEGFGLMFVEAMFCGLPIVCYDHGGQTDFLEEGKTGFLVPLDDLDLFQCRLEALIGDAGLRARLGNENRARSGNYTVERCASRYEAEFEALLRTRRDRAEN